MERRVFLAIILAAVVMYGWQAMFPPPVAPSRPAATPAATPQPGAAAGKTPQAEAAPAAAAASPAASPQTAAITSEPAEREIVVDTAAVHAVLTNRGGRVLHWQLKTYTGTDGQPVDLVPANVPGDQPKPFSLQVSDAQTTQRLNDAIYRVTGDSGGRVDATTKDATVVFEYQDAAGLRVRKEFRFEPRNYVVGFTADVAMSGTPLNPTIVFGPGLGDLAATSKGGSFLTGGNRVQPPQAIYHRDGKVTRLRQDKLATDAAHEGQFRWGGVDDHYFIAAVINPGRARLEYKPLTVPGVGDTQRQLVSTSFKLAQGTKTARYFIGPKQFDVLQSIDGEFVRAIDFGMFAWMVVPLLNVLKWLYGFSGNYGWAIVLLTVLLNLLLFYPRHRSVVAMRKMQAIQPEMKAIQDRYANLKATDPAKQKMNTEIMNLYRERGVNPASGCVPMLFTMPILLAFYSLLSQAIELRGAPFIGWIHDLSAADPYYVLPVLMGISMFWQQRMTPTAADPTQQRVMMIMPVMFTFMMALSPSGVTLYWFVSNAWAIGQQYLTNRLIGPPPAATVRVPADRKIKSAGSGRSTGADKR